MSRTAAISARITANGRPTGGGSGPRAHPFITRARQKYRLVGLPTTVFVDSAGIVQRLHMGAISREELDRGVAAILPLR